MDFRRAPAPNQSSEGDHDQPNANGGGELGPSPFFDETPNDTQRIMQTALTFFHDEVVTPHRENAYRTPAILHPSDPNNLGTRMTRLLYKIRVPELIFCKGVDVCYRFTAKALGEELDLVTLDLLDGEYIQAFEEVERRVIHCITENGFLDQKDIAIGLLDLFANVEKILSAFFDYFVHLAVVVDYNGVVHLRENSVLKSIKNNETNVGFRGAELELDDRNFSFLHPRRPACCHDNVLI